MKILPVKNFTYNNKTKISSKAPFCGLLKRDVFISSLREKQTINEFVHSEIKGDKKLFESIAKMEKKFNKQLHSLIEIGKENGYKGYVNSPLIAGKQKAKFNDIDPKTNLPKNITVYDVEKGFKVTEEIDLKDGALDGRVTFKSFIGDGSSLLISKNNNKIDGFILKDPANEVYAQGEVFDDGFFYIEGNIENGSEDSSPYVSLCFRKNPESCFFINHNSEINKFEIYKTKNGKDWFIETTAEEFEIKFTV